MQCGTQKKRKYGRCNKKKCWNTRRMATFQYRLGNRSALEWVIDQYQVSTDVCSGIGSDPNREEDDVVRGVCPKSVYGMNKFKRI